MTATEKLAGRYHHHQLVPPPPLLGRVHSVERDAPKVVIVAAQMQRESFVAAMMRAVTKVTRRAVDQAEVAAVAVERISIGVTIAMMMEVEAEWAEVQRRPKPT